MSPRLFCGCLNATVADVVDAGLDLLPEFELAAIAMLDGTERPGEWPEIRRRLRAEGIRREVHRGVILLPPGELDQFAAVGFFTGHDELYLCSTWNDEFEPFPGRIGTEGGRFDDGPPLGLEEWMIDAECILAIGDGEGLNFATLDAELAERINDRFPPATT